MTPEELVAEARRQVGATKRNPTATEIFLASYCLQLAQGVSHGFVRAEPARKADLKLSPEPIT